MKKFRVVKKFMSLALVGTFLLSSATVYAEGSSNEILSVSETTATYNAADFEDMEDIDYLGSSDTYIQDNEQNEQLFNFTSPEELSLNSFDGLESIIVDENENAGDKEIDMDALKSRIVENSIELSKQSNLPIKRAATYAPDNYEPNNDFDEAFPYNSTVKMTGNPFSEGYVAAGIHDEDDNDYFSINLSAGTDYFFSLKNLYNDYDLIVFSPDLSGYWANAYYGTTPESFYMNAPTTGTYYVVIVGNGLPEYYNYFFKAVKAIQTKHVKIPSGLTFNFNGAGSTSYLAFDTRSIIPSDAVLNSVRIDSNGTGSWTGLTKYLRASNGRVYSNQDGTGLDYINYPTNTQYASQLWGIAGKVYEPTRYFTWKPNVSMEYTYVEAE